MIDLEIMQKLFSALKPGSRLILLGDQYQLSSVGIGSAFADLVSYFYSITNHHVLSEQSLLLLKTLLYTGRR